ncbi:MAG: DUF4129 domain-containing protein [Chloroflexi bacterium]|nr:DUF4129 domain-containing protein [Chloroflexota bacterium]
MLWQKRSLEAALIVTEVAWLSVVAALLGVFFGLGGSPLPLWALLLLSGVGFLTVRALYSLAFPPVAGGVAAVVAGIGVAYVSVALVSESGSMDLAWPGALSRGWEAARVPVVSGVLAFVLWWSGARAGQSDTPANALARSFNFGIGIVVLGALAESFLPIVLRTDIALFLFFGASLTGFALSQMSVLAPVQALHTSVWPRALGTTLGAVLGGSALLALAVGGSLGQTAQAALGAGLALVEAVTRPIFFLFGYVAQITIELVRALLALFGAGQREVEFNLYTPDYSNAPRGNEWAQALPDWLLPLAGWTLGALVAGGIVFVLVRMLVLRPRTTEREPQEEREALASEGTLGDELSFLIDDVLSRLRRRPPAGRPHLDLDAKDPLSLPLGLYYVLLTLGERLGLQRQPWATPQEFSPVLAGRLPPEEVAVLTAAFVRARYGQIPPDGEEAARLRAAWERIWATTGETKGGGPS